MGAAARGDDRHASQPEDLDAPPRSAPISHRLPPSAAWRHLGGREGFECVFFRRDQDRLLLSGTTAAAGGGEAWTAEYQITVDDRWRTREAALKVRSSGGDATVALSADGRGNWIVDGEPAPALVGCIDVDLESSVCTNTFPVHRLDLPEGRSVHAPAMYVRVPDLTVQRLDQTYLRVPGEDGTMFDYSAPEFDFEARLTYDTSGLIVDYPGIATRSF